MTSKTSYEKITTCDFCGNQIRTVHGDVKQSISHFDAGWTHTGTEFFNPEDMCDECTASYKQWKESRKAKNGV